MYNDCFKNRRYFLFALFLINFHPVFSMQKFSKIFTSYSKKSISKQSMSKKMKAFVPLKINKASFWKMHTAATFPCGTQSSEFHTLKPQFFDFWKKESIEDVKDSFKENTKQDSLHKNNISDLLMKLDDFAVEEQKDILIRGIYQNINTYKNISNFFKLANKEQKELTVKSLAEATKRGLSFADFCEIYRASDWKSKELLFESMNVAAKRGHTMLEIREFYRKDCQRCQREILAQSMWEDAIEQSKGRYVTNAVDVITHNILHILYYRYTVSLHSYDKEITREFCEFIPFKKWNIWSGADSSANLLYRHLELQTDIPHRYK